MEQNYVIVTLCIAIFYANARQINGGGGIMFPGCRSASACVCVHVRGRGVVPKRSGGRLKQDLDKDF